MRRFLNHHPSQKQKQWLWFIVLWLCGLGTVSALAYAIRFIIGLS